jgi:proline dehydrogenase
VRASLPPGLLRPAGRFAAGSAAADAARVTAELVAGGCAVALERFPAGDAAELLLLAARLRDEGLAPRAELTVAVGALGPAAAGSVTGQALECGLGVALEGAVAAVDALAARLPDARVVVPAGEPGAEERCRALGDGPVRLVQGRGAAADLAFVRCLNVLMSRDGSPAVAATDPRLVAIAGERAAWYDRPPDTWEHVMPYGVRTDHQRRLLAAGHRVRLSVPWGPMAAAAVPLRRLAGRS